MAVTENQDHSITLAEAAAMTTAYRNANPGASLGLVFGKNAIQDILNQPGCVGIRYYYGLDNGVRNLVLVGVDAIGNDMHSGSLAEVGLPNPPNGSTQNQLNS